MINVICAKLVYLKLGTSFKILERFVKLRNFEKGAFIKYE